MYKIYTQGQTICNANMQSVWSCKEKKPFADRACSFIIEANFDEASGSISAVVLSPVIDLPRHRLVVGVKEMHNTGKVGALVNVLPLYRYLFIYLFESPSQSMISLSVLLMVQFWC